MLGKRGRQSSLRSFFNKESRKNEAGFDKPNLIQTTISFVATQTVKQASQQSDGESDFSEYNRMALAEYNKERERDKTLMKILAAKEAARVPATKGTKKPRPEAKPMMKPELLSQELLFGQK